MARLLYLRLIACWALPASSICGSAAIALAQTSSSESSLPSYYYSSASDRPAAEDLVGNRPVELPSESTLPPRGDSQDTSPANTTGEESPDRPGGDSSPQSPSTKPLPSESTLPAPAAQSKTQPDSPTGAPQPAVPDLQQLLAESRDRTPWLRLVEAEHTAPIRVIQFDSSGNNLFTAGEDKLVHHWRQAAGPDGVAAWRHQASYRWQVQRAEQGTILSLLSSGDEIYLAGAGADGQRGEIVGLNTRTGGWLAPAIDAAQGPHSPILQLDMFKQQVPRRMVSGDQQQGIAVWEQDANLGTWQHRWLRKPLTSLHRFSPLALVEPDTVVLASQSSPWTIDFVDVADGSLRKRLRRDAPLHSPAALAQAIQAAMDFFRSQGETRSAEQLQPIIRNGYGNSVTSIAATSQGELVAAADDLGFLYLWNDQGQLLLKTVASFGGFQYEKLTFSGDGRYLAAAATSESTGVSIVQLWRLQPGQTPTLERELKRDSLVRGLALDPQGRALVLGHGRRVEVIATEREQPPAVLPQRETIALPRQVAFATELPYRWKFQLADKAVAFDGASMSWMEATDATWQTPPQAAQRFSAESWSLSSVAPTVTSAGEDWVLRDQQRVGRLDLDRHYGEKPLSRIEHLSWVRDPQGEVAGVAVSLSKQNDIWYFALPAAGQELWPLRRVYRGHEGPVQSLDCSPDGRYLISSSQDCTVRLWPTLGLLGAERTSAPRATWGFDFQIVEERLVARNPLFSGPLYLKGLREGDLLKEISYEEFQAGGALRRTTLSTAEEMQAFLEVPRFDLAVRFIFERNGADVPGFQSYTHWRELAAQVIAVDREWALWTPSGFYDASFNGNRLFGWQINRGLERQPDFYRADRFQAVLERPDLIRRLLPTGSVQQAAQVAGKQKIGFGDVLANSLALQPTVRILAPLDDQAVAGHETEIRAEVLLAQGQQLASAKAYVSGVAAAQPRQLRRESLSNGQQRIELSWQATLPSDKNLQIQVYCSTREKLVAADSRQLARAAALSPRRKPKLYLLAAGISEYRDSRVPDLQLGAANAVGFMETLLPAAAELYDVQPIVLTDTSVTPAVWRSTLRQLESQFRQVQADDLILLFVSGHGLLDTNNDYYFVTANARYSDLVRKNFRDCLSFAELASWSDAPCRKIAILDTCHSGAIQPLDSQQLKQAVRYLQSDLILTLTASEGNQLAAEYRGAQASLFTSALQQSLREPQDGNGNGLLDWPELVRQVSDRVTRQSLAGSVPQFPTAGPKDLLESLELPLAGGDGVTTPRPALVSHRNAP